MTLAVGTSIGVAVHSGNGLAGDALLAMADQALYEAKAKGRNRHWLQASAA